MLGRPLLCFLFSASSKASRRPHISRHKSYKSISVCSSAFFRRPIGFFPATNRRNFMSSVPFSPDEAAAGLSDIGANSGANTYASDGNGGKSSTTLPWRDRIAASIARSRKIKGGNYVQIATVDPATNEPRCRTVVFRGFLPVPAEEYEGNQCSGKPCAMKMITDLRSRKVSEATSPTGQTAELVWWFSKSSEQYRIRGRLLFVGGGQFECDEDKFLSMARREQWGNLSDLAREQFYWKEPGIPYTAEVATPPGGRGEDGRVLPPPDNFLLMLLYPRHVDYLRLGDNYRQIDEVEDESWEQQRVNP